jgi:[acyl-carrier-protein] S-malonyltransferase
MTRALVFPGQGSQAVGMGRELAAAFPAARDTFNEVDEALRQPLSQLMFEGPASELVLTENAQPALMAMSLAVMRVLTEGGLDLARHVAFVAGHSLGEYSALAAAGSLAVADAARLLKRRGLAMQRAVPVGAGAMAALLGLEIDAARAVAAEAAEGQVCGAANDNGAGQVVVSGDRAAVERAVQLAQAHGAKRAIMLDVSAPFHCALMAPAAREMEAALRDVALSAPAVPLVANVTAAAVRDPETIKRLLVEQVTGLVRWRESVLYMKGEGVTGIAEIGAGRVLSGLAKRIDRDAVTLSVGTPGEIESFLRTL